MKPFVYTPHFLDVARKHLSTLVELSGALTCALCALECYLDFLSCQSSLQRLAVILLFLLGKVCRNASSFRYQRFCDCWS